ncbi:MAG: PQQ-binding-like beta-propeller repeat protein, partial [Planctomycetes bacterium]|nr:PQQ-binding-like beta-propeller repeat protein [Planctomycetota bacterium]
KDARTDNMMWGMAASPLAYEHKVIVTPGGPDGRHVAAYDCQTGEIIWFGGNHRAGYSAPRVEVVDGIPQILVFGGDGLSGFDPDTGQELWFVEWPTNEQINVAQPILYRGEAILIGSGYGRGSALFEIVRSDGTWKLNPQPRWKSLHLKLKFNGAVLKGDFVYGLDEGILTCLDMRTGKRQWKRGRYGYGQLLLVGDLLLVQAENGEVVLVEASPKRPRELARFQAIEGKTWNHPVLCRGRLLVRNADEAACYDLRSPQAD